MTAKFKRGDKVYLTPRTPLYYSEKHRHRVRTIAIVAYSQQLQANIYYLGNRGGNWRDSHELASDDYPFRSYQLRHAPVNPVNGRPHKPRQNNHKTPIELTKSKITPVNTCSRLIRCLKGETAKIYI